ncbi:GNAT family N-acetyltransferase [Algihabitans albus]|uniref:GNAT family N-acetyltransferase n=1 Tax=Algihabitans albus TaxID=2164067 RepID=UPI000E5D96B5|nr:GNAT family N-acetyltransferase [Algihabitans albus]
MSDVDPAAAIRRAEAADCGGLAALLMEAFAFYGDPQPLPAVEMSERLRRRIDQQPGFEALVAERDGLPVGFAIYAPVFWTTDCELALFLKEIYVTASARGNGIGRALMAEMADIAVKRDWTRLVWTVDRFNRQAIRFYKSLPGLRVLDKNVFLITGESLTRLAGES